MNSARAQNPQTSSVPVSARSTQGSQTSSASTNRSSDYMQRNRTEDPIPPVSRKPTPILRLSNCKFISPKDRFNIGEKFEAQCDAEFLNNSTPTRVKVQFEFITSYDENGKPTKESIYEKFYGYLDLNKRIQKFTITGIVPSPPSRPPEGTEVIYKLRGYHPESESDVSSDELLVKVIYPRKQKNSVLNRNVKVTVDGEALIVGARFVLCEEGKVIKKGKLNEDSSFSYVAKDQENYSLYMVHAGNILNTRAKSEPFFDLPDQSDVVLQLERQKVCYECPAMGGEPVSRLDNQGYRIDPTPTGEYTIEKITPHVSPGKYLFSMIKWGEETRIENGIFQVKRNGKWIVGTSIDPGLTADVVIEQYIGLFKRAGIARTSNEIPKRWILNDFGPIAAYLFKDEDGDLVRGKNEKREQEMFHTTPPDELRKANGLDVQLDYSHGCIHVDPIAMVELTTGNWSSSQQSNTNLPDVQDRNDSKAVFKPGVTVYTHSYDEIIPSYQIDRTARPPYVVHFFPQASTILVYGS